MRNLMYELTNKSGNSIVVRTLVEANNTPGYTLNHTFLREDNLQLIFNGYDECHIKKYRCESLTEMLKRS